jgi:fucose 4-O-acetylase-like acetyltransferase
MILKSGNYTEFKAIGKNIVGIIYSIGTKEWMPGSAPLWYLTALFSVEVMYFILTHKARYKDQLYLIGIIGVIGWLWSKYIQIRLPWNLDVAMTAILFFYFGRIVKDRMIDDVLHKYAIIIMPIAAVSMICCVATPSVYALGANKIGNPAISILGGISGALLIIKIAMLICEMKCAAILAYYGRNTLIVLGLNYIVHNWIDSALGNVMMLRMWIVNYMLQMLFYPIVIWLVGKVPPVKRVYYGEV